MRGASVQPLAGWRDGAPFDAPVYSLVGTPCETVQRSGVCYYPELICAHEIGGAVTRALSLRIEDGRVVLTTPSTSRALGGNQSWF